MKVIKIANVKQEDSSHPIFDGKATVQELVTEQMSKSVQLAVVNFSPGARTKLHIHTADQVVLVTGGKGILATEQEENEVTAGTIIHVPEGERHWHGATQDSSFSQISILPPSETRIVE